VKQTFVQEGEVLLDHGEQRDDGRLHALAAQRVAVLGHVPGRVEHVLQVHEQLLVLAGQLLPRAAQPGHRRQVQAAGARREETRREEVSACVRVCAMCRVGSGADGSPDDGEHGVEVLALPAVQGDLHVVLDGLHPLQGAGLLQDLRGDPEGLLVDHLLKLLQVPAPQRRVQLEQVVHVPGTTTRELEYIYINIYT